MPSVLAIAIGAALGALLRWFLGVALNAASPDVPLGTLASNLIGGYVIGVAVGIFDRRTDLAPQWRLGIVTGFLGGLTTFSTFSAEVVARLQAHAIGLAAATIGAHLVGSVALTIAGIATVAWFAPASPPADEPGEALEKLAGE